jgi:hypothetical protein
MPYRINHIHLKARLELIQRTKATIAGGCC